MTQSKDERNYHAFYQLFAGSSKAELQALKLTTPQSYSYLEKGMINVDAIDDKAGSIGGGTAIRCHHHHRHLHHHHLHRLPSPPGRARVPPDRPAHRAPAGAVPRRRRHPPQNVTFNATDDDACAVGDASALGAAADFLGVAYATFEEALTSRTMQSMSKSIYKIP